MTSVNKTTFISPAVHSSSLATFPKSISIRPPTRLRHVSKRRHHPVASVQTPDSFSTSWYQDSVFASTVDVAAHHIPLSPSSNESDQTITDFHYVDKDNRYLIILDVSETSTEQDTTETILSSLSYSTHKENSNLKTISTLGNRMLTYTKALLNRTEDAPQAQPTRDIRRVLASLIAQFRPGPNFSALLLDCSSPVLRAAWIGSCGFLLVRDDLIQHRSYPKQLGRLALEESLHLSVSDESTDPTLLPTRPLREDALLGQTSIYSDFLQVEPSDLVIAGTDGFFANVSEEQLMAFTRPVQNLEDPTLAIANNTCLASWRTDDPEFLAYYLAIIAANFATAPNSTPYLPFPFPPSPHQDDVTVGCIVYGY